MLLRVSKELWELVAESDGVAGYHLNGDLALWDELSIPQLVKDIDKLLAEGQKK